MCGVCGAVGKDPATLVSLGITYLQHRGHEAASVVSTDGEAFFSFGGLGEPEEVFRKGLTPEMNEGTFAAIGQNRYSTIGSSDNPCNVQPIKAEGPNGVIYGGHNGNFSDALIHERKILASRGAKIVSTMDSEVLVQMVAWAPGATWIERIQSAMQRLKDRGSYTLVLLTKEELIMARDAHGNRPAFYGKFNWGWMVASEDTVLRQFRASDTWELKPGEIFRVDKTGVMSIHRGDEPGIQNWCSFEDSYLGMPSSTSNGVSISEIRYNQGRRLAELYPVPDADVVIGIPDSGIDSGHGFAQASGIPYRQWILRDRKGGKRTFIEPDSIIRRLLAERKYIIVPDVAGMRIVLDDDSIIRGLTLEILVQGLVYFGATSVDVRVAHPTVGYDCPFGVDISTEKRLVAAGKSKEETEEYVARLIQARSVRYLSVPEHSSTQGRPFESQCYGCSTGIYRLAQVQPERNKLALEVG